MTLDEIVREIKDHAENDCGTTIDDDGLEAIVLELVASGQTLTKELVDDLLDKHSTDSGIAVKASEIFDVLKPYCLTGKSVFEQTPKKEERMSNTKIAIFGVVCFVFAMAVYLYFEYIFFVGGVSSQWMCIPFLLLTLHFIIFATMAFTVIVMRKL